MFYPQGAKWEWSGETKGDWHIYDMEVQVVIEESWSKGEQTVDISTFFPGCPYIMNFCNMTQVIFIYNLANFFLFPILSSKLYSNYECFR